MKKITEWEKFKVQCSLNYEYEMYLADAYYSTHRLKKARELYSNLLLKKLTIGDIHFIEEALVRIDLFEGEKKSAIKKIMNMLHKYPEWYKGYALMGRVELDSANIEKAKNFFEKSNSLKTNFNSFAGMSIAYFLEKKYLNSLHAYQMALDLDKAVLLDRFATECAVRSAIQENQWGGAQSVLDAQKRVDKTIESHKPYQELRSQLNEHMRKACPLD